jgi:hypothetical protein
MHNIKFLLLLVVLAAISIPVVACGSSNSDEFVSDSVVEPEIDAVQMTLPDSVFTIDDVAAVGWKKSKELSSETLPGVISVWYGFYKQRDVEVRVYESHETAKNLGTGPADDVTGRGKPDRTGEGAGFVSTRMSYSTYAIVGNLILMCELDIEDCQGLLDGIGR